MLVDKFFKHFTNGTEQRNGAIVVTKLLGPLFAQGG